MMTTERLTWLCLTAGVILACSSNTSFHNEDETGGGAGTPTNTGSSSATAGTEGETGGRATGGDATGGGSNGGTSAGGTVSSGGSEGGAETTGGATSGGSGGIPVGGAGTGGGVGEGGAPGGGTSAGGTDSGGSQSGGTEAGGAPTGGAGGGSGGTASTTVQGTIIDFWGHPVPDVPVDIGGTMATTDSDGQFMIADVPDAYDVTFVVNYMDGGFTRTRGWAYQGLTRRDPTLQVYDGLDNRSGDYSVTQTGGDFTGGAGLSWTLSFGSTDGAGYLEDLGEAGAGLATTHWCGPASTTAIAHALLWERDSSELPLDYLAYDSQNVALSTSNAANFVMDLGGGAVESGILGGTVTPGTGTDRANGVFVRFPSGAAIPIAVDHTGPVDFSYVVPTLSGASLSVSASEGSWDSPPYALAHVDGLTPTSTPALTIPSPATIQLPADGATDVAVGTQFRFNPALGVGGHLVVIYTDAAEPGMFVVTDSSTFTLPEIAGFALAADTTYVWKVESHGDYASVDGMAEPEGFLDAYSADRGTPLGRRRGDGTYTISAERAFVTAP